VHGKEQTLRKHKSATAHQHVPTHTHAQRYVAKLESSSSAVYNNRERPSHYFLFLKHTKTTDDRKITIYAREYAFVCFFFRQIKKSKKGNKDTVTTNKKREHYPTRKK